MDPDLIYEKGVRYYTTPFDIAEALKKPDVKMEDLLDIDGFVEELRANNMELIRYFQTNKLAIKRLIDFITKEPRDERDKKRCYKYPFIAREIFNLGIPVIEDSFFETETSLREELRFRERAFSTRRSISYDDEEEILRTRQDNINFIQKIDEVPEKSQDDDSEDSGDDDSDDDESKKVEKEVKSMEIEKSANEEGEAKKEQSIEEEPKATTTTTNEMNEEKKESNAEAPKENLEGQPVVEEKKEPNRVSTGEATKIRKKNSRKSSDQRLKSKKSNPPAIAIPKDKGTEEPKQQPLSPQPNAIQLKDLNLVNYLFGFLCRDVSNPTLAGYFEICVKNLMNHKTSKLVDYMFDAFDVITNLIKNIGNKSIMEIFCRIVLIERVLMDVDPEKFETFLSKKKTAIKSLVYKLKGNDNIEELENITYCLEQILVSKSEDILDSSELKAYLLGDEISTLLFRVFRENIESTPHSLYYLTLIINSLLKCYSPDFSEPSHLAIMSQSLCIEVCSMKFLTNNIRDVLSLMATHFELFYELLFQKNDKKLQAASGEVNQPLGFLRLNIIKIFHMCYKIKDPEIISKLKSKKVIVDLILLFEKYPWNNILHEVLVKLVGDIIRGCDNDLYKHILEEAKIMDILMDLAKKRIYTFGGRNQNSTTHGYLGHIIKLINMIIDVANKEYFVIKSFIDKNAEWPQFASTILKECNDRNNKNLEEVSEKRTSDILDKIGRVMETQKGGRKVSSENPLEETPSDIMYKKITQTIDYEKEKSFQNTASEVVTSIETTQKEEKEKHSSNPIEIESKDHQFIEPQKQIYYDLSAKNNEKEVFFLPEGGDSAKKQQQLQQQLLIQQHQVETASTKVEATIVNETSAIVVENKESGSGLGIEIPETQNLKVPQVTQELSKSPKADSHKEIITEPVIENKQPEEIGNKQFLNVSLTNPQTNMLNSPTNANASAKMVIPSPNADSARKGKLAWKSQRNDEVVSKVVKTEEILSKPIDPAGTMSSNFIASKFSSELKPLTRSTENLLVLGKASSENKSTTQSKFAARRFSKDDMEIDDVPDEKTSINTSNNKKILGLYERNEKAIFEPGMKPLNQSTPSYQSGLTSSGLTFRSDPLLASTDKYLSGSYGSSYTSSLPLGSYSSSNYGLYGTSSYGGSSVDDIINKIHSRANMPDPLLSRYEPPSYDSRFSYNDNKYKAGDDLGPVRTNQSVGSMSMEKDFTHDLTGGAGKKIFDKLDEKKVNFDSNI